MDIEYRSKPKKFYRILHIPTGLFFSHTDTPIPNRSSPTNPRHTSYFFINDKNVYPDKQRIPEHVIKSIKTKHSMYPRLLATMRQYIFQRDYDRVKNRIKKSFNHSKYRGI